MKNCSTCRYSGRPPYKSPCSECDQEHSKWEQLSDGEKTADEMFREIGYEKIRELGYKKPDGTEINALINSRESYIVKYRIGPMSLTFDEILACAQLIKEMEVEE